MIDKERAKKLLGSNLGPTDVGQALGCDPSYISQLLMDDGFRAEVLALRMEALQAQTTRDRNIDKIEDKLIEKLEENIPYLVKTTDILRAFAILNGAKRRGAAAGGDINFNTKIVQISLPEAARRAFIPTVNGQGEVVQVGEEVTTTMPLAQLLASRLKNRIAAAQETEIINEASREVGSGSSNSAAKETASA